MPAERFVRGSGMTPPLADRPNPRMVLAGRILTGLFVLFMLGASVAPKLLQTDPMEGFGVRIKATTYAGLGIAMPVLLWQIWRFIAPGLYDNEKRYAVPFVFSALVLFALGAYLAYWTMPKALDWLGDIGCGGLF